MAKQKPAKTKIPRNWLAPHRNLKHETFSENREYWENKAYALVAERDVSTLRKWITYANDLRDGKVELSRPLRWVNIFRIIKIKIIEIIKKLCQTKK